MATLLNRRRYMGGGGAAPLPETRLVCKYNVTSTSSGTRLIASTTNVSAVEIDGVVQASVSNSYRFSTTGEHIVKFTLIDNTSFGSILFNGIITLTYLFIPASITTMGTQPLRGVKELETVIINENNTVYDSRDNCNAIVETSTNIIIGGCKGTTFPSSVSRIADYAFQNNSGIISMTFPATISIIGQGAFRYCVNLTTVTVESTTPPTISNLTFGSTSLSAIYVPASAVDTYKAASGWSSFASMIQAIPTT